MAVKDAGHSNAKRRFELKCEEDCFGQVFLMAAMSFALLLAVGAFADAPKAINEIVYARVGNAHCT